MKNPFLKFAACALFAGVFQFSNAQTAAKPSTPSSSGAQTTNLPSAQNQTKQINDLVERIAGEVELTSTQKTKLQAAMKEAVGNYSVALQKARKEDDSKLSQVNSDFVTDIEARIKVILTPDQYNTVMSKENSSSN